MAIEGKTKPEVYLLRAELCARGWNSIRAWARDFGFNPQIVHVNIYRHWGLKTQPTGLVSNRILDALKVTLNGSPLDRDKHKIKVKKCRHCGSIIKQN